MREMMDKDNLPQTNKIQLANISMPYDTKPEKDEPGSPSQPEGNRAVKHKDSRNGNTSKSAS